MCSHLIDGLMFVLQHSGNNTHGSSSGRPCDSAQRNTSTASGKPTKSIDNSVSSDPERADNTRIGDSSVVLEDASQQGLGNDVEEDEKDQDSTIVELTTNHQKQKVKIFPRFFLIEIEIKNIHITIRFCFCVWWSLCFSFDFLLLSYSDVFVIFLFLYSLTPSFV